MTVWRAVRITVVMFVFTVPFRSLGSKFIFPEKSRGTAHNGVLSGWPSESGQIPFQLALRVVDRTGSVVPCGGSIIHSEFGLTSAHCIVGRHTIMIRAGCSNLTRSALMFDTTIFSVHPLFDETNPDNVQPHDIGLISFGRSIEFGSLIQPVRLQRVADMNKNYDGQRMIASGWSIMQSDQSFEPVNWVYLRGISNQECVDVFGKDHVLEDSTICARWYNYTSTSYCVGDSGGPLTTYDDDGVLTQVGISSFVFHVGCHTGLPAGFVRPGHYHDWLTAVTGYNFNWNYEEPTTTTTKYLLTAVPRYYPRTESYIFPTTKITTPKVKILKINKLPAYEPPVSYEADQQTEKEKVEKVGETKNKEKSLDLDEELPGVDLDSILNNLNVDSTTSNILSTNDKPDVFEMDPFVPEHVPEPVENKDPDLESEKLEQRLKSFKKAQKGKDFKNSKTANSKSGNKKKHAKQRKNETDKLEEEEKGPGDFRIQLGDLVKGKIEPEDLKMQLQNLVTGKIKTEKSKKMELDRLLKAEIKKENSQIELDNLARGKIDPEDLTNVNLNVGDLEEKLYKVEAEKTDLEHIYLQKTKPKRLESEKNEIDYTEAEKDSEPTKNKKNIKNTKQATLIAKLGNIQKIELEKADLEYFDGDSENQNAQLQKDKIDDDKITLENLEKLESDGIETERTESERSEKIESENANREHLEETESINSNPEHLEKNEAENGNPEHLENNEPDNENQENLEKNESSNSNPEQLAKTESENDKPEHIENKEPEISNTEHPEKIEQENLEKISIIPLTTSESSDKTNPEELQNVQSDKVDSEHSEKLDSDKSSSDYFDKADADSEDLDRLHIEKINSDKTQLLNLENRSLGKTTSLEKEKYKSSFKIEPTRTELQQLHKKSNSYHTKSDYITPKSVSKIVNAKTNPQPKIHRGEFENALSDGLESKRDNNKPSSENADGNRKKVQSETEESIIVEDKLESDFKDDIDLENLIREKDKKEENGDGEDETTLEKILNKLLKT